MSLDALFHSLWTGYWEICPQAEKIHRLLSERGETIANDHIALRTFDLPGIGIEAMAVDFERAGYRVAGSYKFENKHLDAVHLEPPASGPKVFISALDTSALSDEAQSTIRGLLQAVPTPLPGPLAHLGRPWTLTRGQYQALAYESEYAGWLSAFGFRANHFTVFVNELTTFSDLDELNKFLFQAGFSLNSVGSVVKGGPNVGLAQSSTTAAQVEVSFADGGEMVPGCYYEFAERFPGPDGQLFQGFVTDSADKIFHSTDRR